MALIKRGTGLIAKGGVGLVKWHLARIGIDFTETDAGSDKSDILLHFGRNIIRLEVKTSTQRVWHVNRRQIASSDFHCFVSLLDGQCWIVASRQVAEIASFAAIRSEAIVLIYKRDMPAGAYAGWDTLAETASEPPVTRHVRQPKRGRLAPKVVTKTLASGEVKSYRYDGVTGRRLPDDLQTCKP